MDNIINNYLLTKYPKFNPEVYKILNPSIKLQSLTEYKIHFLLEGLDKLPWNIQDLYKDFNTDIYSLLNPDLEQLGIVKREHLELHFIQYGLYNNFKYSINHVVHDFDPYIYRELNLDLFSSDICNIDDLSYHYLKYGMAEKRNYRLKDIVDAPNGLNKEESLEWLRFGQYNYNGSQYRELHPSLSKLTETELRQHWLDVGRLEYINCINKDKLLVIIPGLGNPHFDTKIQILLNNITTLRKSHIHISLYIFLYSEEHLKELQEKLQNIQIDINIICKPGVIGQFIYNDISNTLVKNYDYILFILDDIELDKRYNINDCINLYKTYNMDILSFPLTSGSNTAHDFMLQKQDFKNNILEVNFIEFFSYFMNPETFYRYKKFFNKDTCWLWGIDYTLYKYNFRLFRIEYLPIKHYFRNSGYSANLPDPNLELAYIKKNYNCISSMEIVNIVV
jgi:hypothetical protein